MHLGHHAMHVDLFEGLTYMGRRFEKDGVGHNSSCTLLFLTRQIDKNDIGHGKLWMIFHSLFH
jgi:hypothetical protein